MATNLNHLDRLSLLKHSLHTIRKLRKKLDEKAKAISEPIAVIGMACRFPGGCTTPEEYWEFLKAGGDGAIDIPPDRWNIDEYYDPRPGMFGKMYLRQGNFLQHDVGEFDAKFFRISPAEATEMDPQHRLLLEVSWEAMENAGQNIEKLKGSQTGVFVGILNAEYTLVPRDYMKVNQYVGTGTLSSLASGRISFTFGLNGPALSVDTACSSSLVSTFHAVESLRRGECDMAIAGGVSMMLSPLATVSLCMIGALARDGRCKPFDANGDGYGRGEGCGIIVLKRLSTARKDGDNILALIQGGAVNNDGASSGLTVPNGAAQKELIKSALSNCAIGPDDISYLEAHGTGTSLGDPIEMKAVTEVFGQGRTKHNPLIIGTVKGNVGHLEGAAGVAGLIKVILCLHHKEIPRNVNYSTPNPRIQLEKIPAKIPLEHMQWNPGDGRGRIAGISSFGFSGTNAHIILSEAPFAEIAQVKTDRSLSILSISAKSETALKNLVRRYADHLDKHPGLDIRDVCYVANAGRADFAHRAAFVGESLEDLCVGFSRFLSEEKKGNFVYIGKIDENTRPKVAFVFSGNLAKTSANAKELYDTLPSFKKTMATCARLFEPYFGCSILDQQLYVESDENRPANQQGIRDAYLFAIEYSLVKLLESLGVKPAAVYGERTGGYVAALTAGAMHLESAIRHVVETSRLMARRKDIKSAYVFSEKDRVEKVLKDYGGKVQITAYYGASEVVITGMIESIDSALKHFKEQGFEAVEEIAGWWPSLLYEEYLEEFKKRLADEKYKAPKVRYISSFSGKSVKKSEIKSIEYWQKHVVLPIEFEKAAVSLYDQGYRLFVEIGAAPHLIEKAASFFSDDEVSFLASIKPENPWKGLLQCIAELYCLGAEINWQNLEKEYIRRKVVLPTYPFESKRYWVAPPPPPPAGPVDTDAVGAVSLDMPGDPLQGIVIDSPLKDKQYEFMISSVTLPEIKDTFGVLHVGYYQEMLARALLELFGCTSYVVKETEFMAPLIISGDDIKSVVLVLSPDDEEDVKFKFYSRDNSQKNWSIHVQGLLQLNKKRPLINMAKDTLAEIQARCKENCSGLIFYKLMEERDMKFGFSVQWIDEVWYRVGEALARFRKKVGDESKKAYRLKIHPGIMDACAQIFHVALSKDIPSDMKYMVVNWDEFTFDVTESDEELWCHVVLHENSGLNETISGRVQLFDKKGKTVASVNNIRMKGISGEKMRALKNAMESADSQGGRNEEFFNKFNGASNDQKKMILTEYLRMAMAKEMGMPLADLDVEEPLRDMGIDSLIALRFKNNVEGGLDIELPLEELIGGPSISQMAGMLIRLLSGVGIPESLEAEETVKLPVDNEDLELWILNRKKCPSAKVRLFCFPYGGGGASLFSRWQDKLSSDIEVCPIQLPGRENRIKEKPIGDIGEVVEILDKILLSELDLPFAIYGHSLGALISYRLAYRLWKVSDNKPLHLFVGAYSSPQIYPNPYLERIKIQCQSVGFGGIPDPAIIDSFTSQQLKALMEMTELGLDRLVNEELLRAVLPMLLSELKIVESYRHEKKELFDISITAFHGEKDDRVSVKEMEGWKELTNGKFKLYELPGDHFFLHEDQNQRRLLAAISGELEKYN